MSAPNVLDDDTARGEFEEKLRGFIGRYIVEPSQSADEVNQAMIRHWVEAMGDENPVYTDAEAARATGRDGVIAPPAMVQAWSMRGYKKHMTGIQSQTMVELMALLESAGVTSVVATDSEQEYLRELVPGDRLTTDEKLADVSPLKKTALGDGYFLTHVRTYRDAGGEEVARQTWRMLRFRPKAKADKPAEPAKPADGEAKRPLRPRAAVNQDLAFWFDAAKEHRLLIQKCSACGDLRHPPGPMCPACNSLEWETAEASGKGTVYSYTVAHHPKLPAFDYPLTVALIELAEGTRLVTNLVDVDPEQISIGMPVELTWIDADDELTLPAFRPAKEN